MKKYLLLLLTMALFASCNDWLDVTPKDKQLEKDQFASEANIQSATNGLYREMVNGNLYGGALTQTTLDVMGHLYTYAATEPSDATLRTLYLLANGGYDNSDEARARFSTIWSTAYTTLLHLNVYLKNLQESTAPMSEKDKNVLLGEAYGLRAYLHFDLFRLFGPAWQNKTGDKILPYHRRTTVVLNHIGYEESEYSTADEFMTLLLEDLETAKTLLEANDPILTDANSITKELPNDNFYSQNRNRRMNYYAVKGLEARVRQYRGENSLAAQAAKVVTDQMGDGLRFQWASHLQVVSQSNYIFFSEVIFGINNVDFISQSDTRYMGTDFYAAYLVDQVHLTDNIYGVGDLSASIDIRSKQWATSNITTNISGYSPNTCFSKKYLNTRYLAPQSIPAIRDLQPLMRMSEMYYIQAEAALKAGQTVPAVNVLNTIMAYRGLTDAHFLPETATQSDIQAHIEKEYYREFFGEGQVFFYHKRQGSTSMFKGYEAGRAAIADPAAHFVVPVPNTEKNV